MYSSSAIDHLHAVLQIILASFVIAFLGPFLNEDCEQVHITHMLEATRHKLHATCYTLHVGMSVSKMVPCSE